MQALLQMARLHSHDDYLHSRMEAAAAALAGHRLSQRQQRLLVARIAERLPEPLSVDQLAGWLGLSIDRLLPAF